MAIGEIILSAVLQVLFQKLASLGLTYVQRKGAPSIPGVSIDLLSKWKKMLDTINAVLEDAEDKQLSGNRLVKLWMDDVRDLAYDIEDLLDEFEIQAAQAKSKANPNTSGTLVKWTVPFISQHNSSISDPKPRSLTSETEVQKINDRLEDIITRKANLSLTENVVGGSHYTNKRLPSTSLPEPHFFGREKVEAEILEILTGEAKNGDTTLSIVPIVGMGGVGKTALAQRLYNDAKVSSCFERRAWVCVSDVFNVLGITKTILRSITGSSNEGEDLNMLQVKLKGSLMGKKFLVVLDDVWNENYGEWYALLKPFLSGAKGSKVIVTTRNSTVVSITGALSYALTGLSLDNCTNVLAFHALGAPNFEKHPNLEEIGKKIAEKCQGSPLAARVLGGLLRDKRNSDQWEAILNNKMWDVSMGENDEVLQVLKVSYAHLPSYLKRCFVYCAVFPQDYEIERDELVLLWMAEGFLDEKRAKDNILKLGQVYFDELVSRSFLQQSSVNISKFSMHDLLNDLAKSIAGGTCFTSGESQLASNEDNASLEKTRYASSSSSWYITSKCTRVYQQMKVLRSFMLLYNGSHSEFQFNISNKVLHDLLTELKYLRVFSLCYCSIIEVPNCVGDLKHLRYLNFSYTCIERLPESIAGLCKLQALILRGCRKLRMLPSGTTDMVSLQFLDIRDTDNLKEMPLGIGNLKNLIILSKFAIGAERGSQLKELKSLSHLQGELFISELQTVEEVKDAVDANLFEKQGLSELSLRWDEDFGKPRNAKHEWQVLHHLRPFINLENLTISYYGGAMFPSWLDSGTYSKMVSLCLRSCPNVTSLPSLGQLPSLRELSLQGLHMVRTIGSEFYGSKRPFSSLIALKFDEMMAWKDWSHHAEVREEEASFYGLQHLVVRCCPSLIGTLPRQLDHLIKLKIDSCPHLNNSSGEICLPSLRELYLKECDKEILKSLVNLTSLTVLKIENLTELVCFDRGFTSCLVKLKKLHVRRCDKLTYLWQDGMETQSLTCLQELVIQSCPCFTFFAAGERGGELPCNLERMELRDCESVEKLPSKIHTLKKLIIEGCPKITGAIIPQDGSTASSNNLMYQLESLVIYNCNSPISLSFAEGRFDALKTLHIVECEGMESLEEITLESLDFLCINTCKNLRSLPQSLHTLSRLTTLYIDDCPELEIEEEFPLLPITLSSFTLSECPKIKSMSIAIPNNLTYLRIGNCPALEMEEFPPLPITFSSFSLIDCPKIRCLPNQWHHLPSLHEIQISDCPIIEDFPKGGFPPSLRRLTILGCENVKQLVREWGLPFLTSLQSLLIDGRSIVGREGEKVCFPSDDDGDAWTLLFPSSLTSLTIENMRNVERLSSGLRSQLSSLTSLSFNDCPKLRDLPEDGLPPSLHRLSMSGCPILKDRCSKLTGHYWSLIQHIPSITIDYHPIR